jgi:hypothetical protein
MFLTIANDIVVWIDISITDKPNHTNINEGVITSIANLTPRGHYL